MFNCRTEFSCDICGHMYSSENHKMTHCISKEWYRHMLHEKGWKTIYGAYDVCRECVEHYGLKHVRKMLIEKAKKE